MIDSREDTSGAGPVVTPAVAAPAVNKKHVVITVVLTLVIAAALLLGYNAFATTCYQVAGGQVCVK